MQFRSTSRLRAFAAAVLLAAVPAVVHAQNIFFRHTGENGSGTIGTTTFTNRAFTVLATGNTGARQSFSGGFFIDHVNASIDISGVGTFNFVTATRTFVNNSFDIVGFSRAGGGGADLYNGPTSIAFDTWAMLTSIGPIAGSANLLQWTNSPVQTSGGVLVFNSATMPAVFQATVVPEPSTYALVATGLVALVVVSRRRRSTT